MMILPDKINSEYSSYSIKFRTKLTNIVIIDTVANLINSVEASSLKYMRLK